MHEESTGSEGEKLGEVGVSRREEMICSRTEHENENEADLPKTNQQLLNMRHLLLRSTHSLCLCNAQKP